jgi:flagellar hook assembly protein FlgD
LALLPIQPNPTTGSVAIRFLLPRPGKFSVEVYDLAGRLVKQVKAGEQMPGEHRVTWDGKDSHGGKVPSGVYFVKLQAGTEVRTKKMILTR